MKRSTHAVFGLGALTLFLATGTITAQTVNDAAPGVSWTTVTDVSGTTAFLEIGTRHGLRTGTALVVVRSGTVIGELTVQYVSANRTACTITRSTSVLVVGDSVRFVPVPEETTPGSVALATSSRSYSRGGDRSTPIRGRIGLRYLKSQQSGGTGLTQPAVDLRLDGTRIGGSGIGFAVDVRTHRTSLSGSTVGASSSTLRSRAYQAMVSVQSPDGGVRVAVGRQFSSALSPIGIFDGAALERAGDRWSAGLLLGTQPDVETFAPSTATKEVGLWLQRHQSAGAGSAWSATVGAIGSYQDGVVNREFGYLRGTYSSRAISIYAAQEIDVNRGWKRELEGSAATLTSTFLTARVDIVPALSVGGGFDSRRTIRLYRDMVNPEISFDDAYRRGGWGDLTVRLSSRVRVSADARAYGGGSGTGNTSVTGTFSANRLTRLQFGLRARSTRFTGASSGGSLNSMVVEVAPTRALRLGMNAGQRTNPPATLGSSLARMSWLGADVDLALSRMVYLLISTYRQSAGASRSIQSFGSLSWRF